MKSAHVSSINFHGLDVFVLEYKFMKLFFKAMLRFSEFNRRKEVLQGRTFEVDNFREIVGLNKSLDSYKYSASFSYTECLEMIGLFGFENLYDQEKEVFEFMQNHKREGVELFVVGLNDEAFRKNANRLDNYVKRETVKNVMDRELSVVLYKADNDFKEKVDSLYNTFSSNDIGIFELSLGSWYALTESDVKNEWYSFVFAGPLHEESFGEEGKLVKEYFKKSKQKLRTPA